MTRDRSVPPALPPLIRRLLTRVDRRRRAVLALRGLGTTAFVAALGAALGMTADLVWELPSAVRWGIWGGWLSAVGLTLAWRVVRPLTRRVEPLDLAALVERADPSLGERLTATVGLLGGAERRNGSPALAEATASNASAYAGLVAAAAVVPLRSGTKRFALGVSALILVVAPSLLQPDPFRGLGQRFLAPWADLERVGRFALQVRPGDATAALGADFLVSARVSPRFGRLAPDSAWLEWIEPAGSTGGPRRVTMPALEAPDASRSRPAAARDFAVTLPRLAGSLRYRVGSGSAVSRWFHLKAIAPPAVVSVTARVEPPAYTGLPATSVRDARRIEAWEGSRVVLGITASRPVVAAAVEWPTRARSQPLAVAAALTPDRTKAEATLTAEASGAYSLSLRDDHGLAGAVEPLHRLVVRADAPPVVSVHGPAPTTEARADDVLRLGVAARDDVAVAAVELHYTVVRPHAGTSAAADGDRDAPPESGRVAVAAPGLGTRSVRGEAALELRSLGLKAGDTVSYRVRAADNRPAPRGPNVVWTSVGTLTIAAAAEPLLARQDRAEREALQAKLDALKAAAAENRKEAEQLRYAADAAQREHGLWDRDRRQALSRREAAARELSDRLQLLARELADTPGFQRLARPTRRIAEGEAEPARVLLDQARTAVDPAGRFNDLRQADARFAAVSSGLDDLQRRFDALARSQADLHQIQDLAGREEAIARQAEAPDAMEPADQARLDRLQADQAEVQKDLESLRKQSPELQGDRLDEALEAMREASRRLASARRPEPARNQNQNQNQPQNQASNQEASSGHAAQAAKPALERAAQALNAAARQVADSQGDGEAAGAGEEAELASAEPPAPGTESRAGESPSDAPRGAGTGTGDGAMARPGTLDLGELKALLQSRTGRSWGELPGHLRTEILQTSQSRYRDEYSRLIQRYFREIASGDSETP